MNMKYLGKSNTGYKFGNKWFAITIHPELQYYEAVQEARDYFYGGGITQALIMTPLKRSN